MRFGARPAVVLSLLPLLLAAAAGCGGKSDKEKLADDVNPICRDLKSGLQKLGSASSLGQTGKQAKALIPEVDRATTRLAKVKASKDVRRKLGNDYTKFVATFRAQAIAYGAIVSAAQTNDQRSVQKLVQQLATLTVANDRRAKKLGFDDCTSDSG